MPATMTETASNHRAPYLSNNRPMIGPVMAPEAPRAVEAHPKAALPILKSSPIGFI